MGKLRIRVMLGESGGPSDRSMALLTLGAGGKAQTRSPDHAAHTVQKETKRCN